VYQVTVTLTEQEYQALILEATQHGTQPEAILHDFVRRLPSIPPKRVLTDREITQKLFEEGVLANIPTRKPLSEEEQAQREKLSQQFSSGKLASEMVIEDRGPY
jgi:hypothetical protein